MESARRIREKELAKKEQKEIDKYAKKVISYLLFGPTITLLFDYELV